MRFNASVHGMSTRGLALAYRDELPVVVVPGEPPEIALTLSGVQGKY